MSPGATAALADIQRQPVVDAVPARVALLGSGTVGRAVLARLAEWGDSDLGTRLSLVYAPN